MAERIQPKTLDQFDIRGRSALVTDHPEGCKLWGWMVGPIEFYDNEAKLIETVDVWWMMNHYESYCQERGIAVNPKLYL